MARGRVIQNSLNAGEMSPHMEGRVDFPRYQNSAATLENFLIHTQGGVSRRWGTRFVAEAKVGATAVRLIPFVVNESDHYVLEFGVGYIRVIRPLGSVGHTASVDIVTTYTEAELFQIEYAQSNDVLYLAHQNHPVRKLIRQDVYGDAWSLTQVTFLPPPTFETEQSPAWTIALAAVTGSGIKFYVAATQLLAADIDRIISSGTGRGVVASIDASNKFGTIDILDDFSSALIVAGLGNASGAATTITTSVAHGLTAANVGDLILITSGAQSGQSRRIDAVPGVDTLTIDAAFPGDPGGATWNRSAHIAAGSWEWLGSPSAKLTSDKVGPVRGIATLTLDIAGFRSTDVDKYIHAMGGLLKITSFTTSTSVKAQIMANLSSAPSAPFETLAGTWTIEDESWTSVFGYPGTICFYEQRLFFGGTTEQPQTLWGSATADFEIFARGALATDSVQYTIASNEVNTMKWMASSRVLLIGALAREYRASGGSDAITPTNIDIRGETSYGSAKRKPLQIGQTTIFLSAAGRKIRELSYNFDNDAYRADDLTVLNPEVSSGGFNDMAYSKEPLSLVFCVRNDGQLCALTYEKSQEVMGWGRWITDGYFESVCVLPPVDDSGEDNVYVLVNRNGGRLIEKFDSSLNTDSAKTGAGPTTVITGLDHLNGMTVRMKGDGALYPDAVVAAGQVAFPESVDAYEVGLGYTATVVTARPEMIVGGMSTQGKPKRWSAIYVRVYNTIGLLVNGERQWVRDTQDFMGSAPAAETGFLRANTLEVDQDARLTLVQDLPFPATILMVVGELAAGD